MTRTAAKIYVVHGCHDCPFLEVHAFGHVSCPHTELPEDLVVDPFNTQLPPKGCPLLNGGSVRVCLSLGPEMPF